VSRLAFPAAIVALALGLGLFWTLRGQASNETPSPAAALGSLVANAGPLVVFSEFGENADTIWVADPDAPAQRKALAQVPHATGFGILPSLSPDGTRLAYTVAATPDFKADLWVLDISGGEAERLASGLDLRAAPVWAPDSGSVVVRRSEGAEGELGRSTLLRVDLDANATVLAALDTPLYGIDFSPDGAWFYFATLGPAGSDLARAPAAGGPVETIAHLSDGFARDWTLSPDGRRIAYLAQAGNGFAAFVLDIERGAIETPLGEANGAQFNPVWQRSGALTIGRLESSSAGGAVTLDLSGRLRELPARGRGFDVPLVWSPDGRYLALRAFEGSSTADPGPSWVYVLGSDGARHRLSDRSDVEIAGWLEVAP
jgi:hypothetical protein